VINNFNTNYRVVAEAAENLGWKVQQRDHNLKPSIELLNAHRQAFGPHASIKPEEFDIVWFDLTIPPEVVQKLHAYQRVSQWPGIQVLSHKNKMAKNLSLM
jgi:hypothetical protein